jgi:catechol 2,3-dioxygenase-like lactoylglutathione lyase family enzyme
MTLHVRIARPVSDLARSVAMYKAGLDLQEICSFQDHAGFDGVMLAIPGKDHHFEFTRCRTHPVLPSPTPEDLLVFYVPDPGKWNDRCAAMLAAGFVEAEPFNPYWKQRGRTFRDPDGYRVVIQQAAWGAQSGRSRGE